MMELRTEPKPTDPVNGRPGEVRHHDLVDKLFGVPGRWRVRANADMFWLDPAPLQEDIPHAYVNYHTHEDGLGGGDQSPARAGWYHTVREKVWAARKAAALSGQRTRLPWQALIPPVHEQLRFDSGFLPVMPGGKLLDIGCGAGELVERLSALGWDARGIDPDPQAVRHAQAMGRPVSQAGVESLAEQPGGLDAATLYHVIEHVYDPVNVVRDVHNLLKPGGRIVLVTPNARSLASRLFGPNWRGLEPPRHLQVFTRRSLHEALSVAGFNDIHVSTSYRDASGMVCASHAIKHNKPLPPRVPPTRPVRLLGDAILIIQWLLTRLGLAVGEELVAVARKG